MHAFGKLEERIPVCRLRGSALDRVRRQGPDTDDDGRGISISAILSAAGDSAASLRETNFLSPTVSPRPSDITVAATATAYSGGSRRSRPEARRTPKKICLSATFDDGLGGLGRGSNFIGIQKGRPPNSSLAWNAL